MATPIKETPNLYGPSSNKFKRILVSEQDDIVSSQEKKGIEDLVRRVLSKKRL